MAGHYRTLNLISDAQKQIFWCNRLLIWSEGDCDYVWGRMLETHVILLAEASRVLVALGVACGPTVSPASEQRDNLPHHTCTFKIMAS